MAVRIIHQLLSDLSGDEASHTVRFGLDNKDYVIDLTDEESEELRTFMERYISAGQRADKARRGTTYAESASAIAAMNNGAARSSSPLAVPQKERALYLQSIRDWANKKGLNVANRGRVPQTIIDMFENRHALESAALAEAAEKANKHHAKPELDVVDAGVPVKANGSKVQAPAGRTVPAPAFSSPEQTPAPVKANGKKVASPVKKATVTRPRRTAAAR